MGTVHLLEAVRQSRSEVRAIINVTSDKCYQNGQCVGGYSESHPMGGSDPYSSSKGCAELVTAAFRHSFFDPDDFENHRVALASARAGNVIGGGDWGEDRLLPDIVRAIFDGSLLMIRCPHAVRPWQFVLDPLGGYLLLAEKLYQEGPKYAEGWNFGPSDYEAKPVSWIVEQFYRLWGKGFQWEIDDRGHPYEAPQINLDCSKARLKLGWKPWLSLHEALEWTSIWYRQYRDHPDSVRETTKLQIADYTNLLRT
jgi:CDP-glucose 4,6-dehydratase